MVGKVSHIYPLIFNHVSGHPQGNYWFCFLFCFFFFGVSFIHLGGFMYGLVHSVKRSAKVSY